jgi:hypothetical protein
MVSKNIEKNNYLKIVKEVKVNLPYRERTKIVNEKKQILSKLLPSLSKNIINSIQKKLSKLLKEKWYNTPKNDWMLGSKTLEEMRLVLNEYMWKSINSIRDLTEEDFQTIIWIYFNWVEKTRLSLQKTKLDKDRISLSEGNNIGTDNINTDNINNDNLGKDSINNFDIKSNNIIKKLENNEINVDMSVFSKYDKISVFSYLLNSPHTSGLINKLSLDLSVPKAILLNRIVKLIESKDWKITDRDINAFINNFKKLKNNDLTDMKLLKVLLANISNFEFNKDLEIFKNYNVKVIDFNSFLLEKIDHFFWRKVLLKVYKDNNSNNYIIEWFSEKWKNEIKISARQLKDLLEDKIIAIWKNKYWIVNWNVVNLETLKSTYKQKNVVFLSNWKKLTFLSNKLDTEKLLFENYLENDEEVLSSRKKLSIIVEYILNIVPLSKLNKFLKEKNWEIVFISNDKLDNFINSMFNEYYNSEYFFKNELPSKLLPLLENNRIISPLDREFLSKLDIDKSGKFETDKVIEYPKLFWFLKILFPQKRNAIRTDYEMWNVITDKNIFSERFIYETFKTLEKKNIVKNREDFDKIYNKIIKIWLNITVSQKIYENYKDELIKLKSKNIDKKEKDKILKEIQKFKLDLTKKLFNSRWEIFRVWFVTLYNIAKENWRDLISQLENLSWKKKYEDLSDLIENDDLSLINNLNNKNIEKIKKLTKEINKFQENFKIFWPVLNKISEIDEGKVNMWVWLTKSKIYHSYVEKDFFIEQNISVENWNILFTKDYNSIPLWNWEEILFKKGDKMTYYYISPKDWWTAIIKKVTKWVYEVKYVNKKQERYSFKVNLNKWIVDWDLWNIKWLTALNLSINNAPNSKRKIELNFDQNFNFSKKIITDKVTALNLWFTKDLLNSLDNWKVNISLTQDITDRFYVGVSNSVDTRKFFDYITRQENFRYLVWYRWDQFNVSWSFREKDGSLSLWLNVSRTKKNIMEKISKATEQISEKDAQELLSIVFPNANKDLIRQLTPKMKEALQNSQIRENLRWTIDSIWMDYTFIPNVMTLFSITLWIIYDVKIMKQLIPWDSKKDLEVRQYLLSVADKMKNVRYIKDINLDELKIWENKYKLIPDFILNDIPTKDRLWVNLWIRKVNVFISPELQNNVIINENWTFSLNWRTIVPSIFKEYTLDWWVILNIYFWDDIKWSETKSEYMFTSGDVVDFKNLKLHRVIVNPKELLSNVNIKLYKKQMELIEKKMKVEIEKNNKHLKWLEILKKIVDKNENKNIWKINELLLDWDFSNQEKLFELINKTFEKEIKQYELSIQDILFVFYGEILKKDGLLLKLSDKNWLEKYADTLNVSLDKINKFLWQIWIKNKIDISDLKEILSSKEKRIVNWGLSFAITSKWLLNFFEEKYILTNTRQIKLDIPNSWWHSLLITEWIYKWNIVLNLQLRKADSKWYVIEWLENFNERLTPLLKKISLTLGYMFVPPKFSSKTIVVEKKLKDEKLTSDKDAIVWTFKKVSKETLINIMQWKTIKVGPNFFKWKEWKYWKWVEKINEDINFVNNKLLINKTAEIKYWENTKVIEKKEYTVKFKELNWNNIKSIKLLESKPSEISFLNNKLKQKGINFNLDGFDLVKVKLTNWQEIIALYNDKNKKLLAFKQVYKKEVYINGEKIKTPEEFWVPKMSEQLWDNKDKLKQAQYKADQYISYLASKLNSPDKIAAFIDEFMSYYYDNKTSSKFYWNKVYPEGMSWLNVVMQYAKDGIEDDCDWYAALITSILKKQWLPAYVNTSFWDAVWHAYSQLHFYDIKSWKWYWATFWTFWVEIESWDTLKDVQSKLYNKYWYLWTNYNNAINKFWIYTNEKWNIKDYNGKADWWEIDIFTSELEKNEEYFSQVTNFVQDVVNDQTVNKGNNFYHDVSKINIDNVKNLFDKAEEKLLEEKF